MTKRHETESKHVVSKGQALLESVAAWILGYMSLKNPDDAKVLALWAIGTHRFYRLYTYPYLILTKGQPGCGATVLMELIARLSLNAWQVTVADAALWRKLQETCMSEIHHSVSARTIAMDEADHALKRPNAGVAAFWNGGYRFGAVVAKVVGKETIDFPAFCPKIATMIGSTAATLIDRSLIQVLYRAPAPKLYRPEEANAQGKHLHREIVEFWSSNDDSIIHPVEMSGLSARDLEIWSSMLGVAVALGCDEATLRTIKRLAIDNCQWKKGGENLRRLVVNRSDDSAEYAIKALRDILSVMGDSITIHTDLAVAKMKEIDSSPWRTFEGDGLDPIKLGKLMADAGVERSAATVKIKGIVKAGYKLVDLKSAIERKG